MSATGPASRSVARLIVEEDPFPKASPVMPIAFPCLDCTCRPSLHHGEDRRILPVAKFSWLLPPESEDPPSIFVARQRERRALDLGRPPRSPPPPGARRTRPRRRPAGRPGPRPPG